MARMYKKDNINFDVLLNHVYKLIYHSEDNLKEMKKYGSAYCNFYPENNTREVMTAGGQTKLIIND